MVVFRYPTVEKSAAVSSQTVLTHVIIKCMSLYRVCSKKVQVHEGKSHLAGVRSLRATMQ